MDFDHYDYYTDYLPAGAAPLSPDKPADRVVVALLCDVTDRRGWRQEWDMFDHDIKGEIIVTWRAAVVDALADPVGG